MSKKSRTGYNPLDDLLPQIQDTREDNKPQEKDKNSQSKPQTKTKAKTVAQTYSQTFTQTSANNIKQKASQGITSQRLEDNRRRQTYWMDQEEIKMITEISKRSGVGKYQLVSAAVRLLYEYVFPKGNEEE